MSAKHTPGPWTVKQNGKKWYHLEVIGAEGAIPQICRLALVDKGPACVDANARLIAAAPDLLKALKEVVELIKTGDHITEAHYGSLINGWASKIDQAEGRAA